MRGPRNGPARFDIGDIVRAHRAELESSLRLTPQQKRVLTDIAQCRTAVLGGHVDQCESCGYEHPAYNSCRNRHCPKCQALAQERWIGARRERMLDVRHFHVVFTLPSELRALCRVVPRVVLEAFFHSVHKTLVAFGKRRMKAHVGVTTVLHTWTRKLEYHPHLHAIVTGGGLSLDGASFVHAPRNFLFPVKAMSQVFRGKMMTALGLAYRDGKFAKFRDFEDPEGFSRLMARVAKLPWNTYAKAPFKKGTHVLDYLGRYTHRVGIANSRLLKVTPSTVTFRTKNGLTESLAPVAFLRRFVQHVLPDGFHKIRHAGLYAPAAHAKREAARSRLGQLATRAAPLTWQERLRSLTGRDLSQCPRCGGLLVAIPLPRAPPTCAA